MNISLFSILTFFIVYVTQAVTFLSQYINPLGVKIGVGIVLFFAACIIGAICRGNRFTTFIAGVLMVIIGANAVFGLIFAIFGNVPWYAVIYCPVMIIGIRGGLTDGECFDTSDEEDGQWAKPTGIRHYSYPWDVSPDRYEEVDPEILAPCARTPKRLHTIQEGSHRRYRRVLETSGRFYRTDEYVFYKRVNGDVVNTSNFYRAWIRHDSEGMYIEEEYD